MYTLRIEDTYVKLKSIATCIANVYTYVELRAVCGRPWTSFDTMVEVHT